MGSRRIPLEESEVGSSVGVVGFLRKAGSEENGVGDRSTGHSLLGVVEKVSQFDGFNTGPQVVIELIATQKLRP